MEVSWAYVKKLAQRSEQIGFNLTLIAELNLNDIKGVEAPSLDAWSTAAALAAGDRANRIDGGGAADVPSSGVAREAGGQHRSDKQWAAHAERGFFVWADEARKYGVAFEQHDDRYARTSEWLDVLDGVWRQDHFSYSGKYYRVEDNVLEPNLLRSRGQRCMRVASLPRQKS